MRRHHRSLALLVAGGFAVVACGSEGTSESPDDDPAPAEATADEPEPAPEPEPAAEPEPESDPGSEPEPTEDAGPEIAEDEYRIDLGDGITVTVPAGERADVAAELLDVAEGGATIDLAPDGATFDDPVIIRAAIPVPDASPGTVAVEFVTATLTDAEGEDRPVEITTDPEGVDIAVRHFSEGSYSRVISEANLAFFFAGTGLFSSDPSSTTEESGEATIDATSNRMFVGQSATMDLQRFLAETQDENSPFAGTSSQPTAWEWVNVSGAINADEQRPDLVTCTFAGDGLVVASTWVDGVSLRATASITCVEPAVDSGQFEMVQVHDGASIPQETLAQGALSAIKAALLDPALTDVLGDTFLILDSNGTGVLDEGDTLPFPPGTTIEDCIWHAIDQGGSYFLGFTALGEELSSDQVPLSIGSVEIGEGGVLVIDGQPTALRVVLTEDGSGAASWNVDFGADVMEASG